MIDCTAAECLQRHFPYQTVNSVHVHEQTDSLIRQALMSIINHHPITKHTEVMVGGRVVRRFWVIFQCRGLLQFGYSRARAFCPCSRCRWGLFGHFFSHLSFSPLYPSLWKTARYRLKYCLKRLLNPKQPTNHRGNVPM